MGAGLSNVWLSVAALNASFMAFPRVSILAVTAAASVGAFLCPQNTAVASWLILWTVGLPQILVAHTGYYGQTCLGVVVAYWVLTYATRRLEKRFRVSDKGILTWVRSSKFWEYLAAYFPAKVCLEAPLPPEKGPYLMVCHPHGLWSTGVWTNIIPTIIGTSGLPPRRVCTLDVNFYLPVMRDILFAMGLISSSAQAIRQCLNKGISVGLVVGGGREAMLVKPGTLDLVLNKRRGFVKIAMQTGASLVPILTFGETALYAPGGFAVMLNPVNQALLRTIGFSLPILSGWMGTFQPYAVPINTIVGEPFVVEKNSEPSPDQIEQVHAAYCAQLRALYDKHKDALDIRRNTEMRFTD